MTEIELNANEKNLSDFISALKMLIEQAETKVNHMDRLRQVNFSLTLFAFAGLISFGLNQDDYIIQICITVVLTALMIILSDYDNSLHKYLHGWRKTKLKHLISLSNLINKPNSNVTIQTYYKEGEERATQEDCHSIRSLLLFIRKPIKASQRIPSRMRVVYYLLVRGAIISVIPFMLVKKNS